MRLAELSWSVVLSIVAIVIEVLFIPWYLLTLVIIGRAIRDSETRQIDPVTLGLFGLICLGLLHTVLMIVLLSRLVVPLDLLIALLVLDALSIVIRTYFMWHLQLKVLLSEWLKKS